MNQRRFKQCPGCGKWFSLKNIMECEHIKPVGMSFESKSFGLNVYYFNHQVESCGTTFLIPVKEFIPVLQEPIPCLDLTGTSDCEMHCMYIDDLTECSRECIHAPFRRFLVNIASRREGQLVP